MKYTFKNGAVVEGTVDQILSVAKSLGETVNLSKLGDIPRGYYNSEHHGIMKISGMNEGHLRNALTKRAKNHFESLSKKTQLTTEKYLLEFVGYGEDAVSQDLISELTRRVK